MSPSTGSYRRLAVAIVLLLAQFGLLVHYGDSQARCPNVECYATNYDAAVGETVRVGGPIVTTDPTTVAIKYDVDQSLRLELTGISVSPEKGTLVSVYGRFRSDHRLAVTEIIVKPPQDRRFMFTVSALGIILVGALGLRQWSVNLQRIVVSKRSER